MAKDINIHLKTKGTQQVKQELNQTGQAAAKVGDSAEKGGRKGSEGIGKLSDSAKSANSNFSDFKGTMSDWLGSMAGVAVIIAGITKAINAQNQAMDEHARIAAEQQKNLLNLQYLGDLFKEKPELRKEVAALAESAGRPFEEVARTWYTIRSQGGTLTSGQRQSILKEVAELGRTEPNADLESLAKAFLLYTKSTKAKDANLVQNILKQTLTEAGTDITGMGEFLPRFLPVALQAGLTGPEASGLWAFATGQLGSPAEATTGLKAAFLALQGKGTPESQELLKRLGVTPQMGFFEKIKTLSAQQEKGRFGAAEAQTLAGETGIVILLSMLRDYEGMMKTVGSVVGKARSDIDLTKDAIDQLLSQDEAARLEEDSRRLGVALENIKAADTEAMRWDKLLKEYELAERRSGTSEYMIKYRKSVLRNLRGIGVSADTARKYFTPMSPEQRKLLDEKGTLLETPELEPPKVEQLALAASVVPSPVGAGPGFGFATHVINNYRIGMILNPVAGINKADLGMGPSATRNLQ